MVREGEPAPDFTLPDQHGHDVTLSDLRGRTVVLYFYPRADTPGCTAQACGIRDRTPEYERAEAVVVGVSPDPQPAVAAFAEKYGLEFPLLADEHHEVADLYGTWVEKHWEDSTYWGAQRATFIIGRDGRITHVFPKVSPKTHDDVILEALAVA